MTYFLPETSVIVPIYNSEKDLPELIHCFEAQTYPREKVEYLLVDNNSNDATFTTINNLSKTSSVTINGFSEGQIQSSYAARNLGVHHAKASILVFTDADCRPQPQWLEKIIIPFAKENVVMVAGEVTALPGKTLLERYAERQETLSQKHTLAHKFYPYGQTANLAIRRQALEKVGLFRPYLTTGGDADICWRILQQNIGNLEFAPDAIVQHRHRATLKELESQWKRYGRSNRYLHELHGIELMKEVTNQECWYRLARWIVKEVPFKIVKGQTSWIDLLNTPLGIFTSKARYQGQSQAQLTEKAKIIEYL
jgi:cellulose synthase/poly-beta-1,6-N-acetylglucosamine synthase-like glycosyltransferase